MVAKIGVGKDPNDIAVNPTKGKVYTTNTDSDSVTVIEASISTMISHSRNTSVPGSPWNKSRCRAT